MPKSVSACLTDSHTDDNDFIVISSRTLGISCKRRPTIFGSMKAPMDVVVAILTSPATPSASSRIDLPNWSVEFTICRANDEKISPASVK